MYNNSYESNDTRKLGNIFSIPRQLIFQNARIWDFLGKWIGLILSQQNERAF